MSSETTSLAAAIDEAKALQAAIAAANAEYDLKAEIEELTNYVIQIAESFANVIVIFTDTIAGTSTSWDLKIKLGTALAHWIGHCVKFGETLLLSVNVAADALDTSNEFINSILPALVDDNKTMAQKKQVATSFLNSLDSRATQAERMSQGFSDVNNDIRAFVVDFENMLAGYDLNAMEKRIKELDVQIKQLADDMKELQSTLDSLNKQLESAQSAAAVTGIFGFLFPVFWIGTAISATQISSLKRQLASVRDEYNRKLTDHRNKETERRNLQADIKAIPLLRSAVVKSTPDIDNVRYKIGAFATVWAAIRADTQGILEKLEYATDTESMTLFKLRVQTAADMYKILQAALNDYKEYLDQSREFKEILEKYGIHI